MPSKRRLPWHRPGDAIATRMSCPAFLRRAAHAAVLMFAAFWLAATSYAPAPRDCYTGLDQGALVRVVLGSPTSDSSLTCNGADGLEAGAALELHLVQGPLPFEGCRSYTTQSISGVDDVTLVADASTTMEDELTSARGTFQSAAAAGCRGTWRLKLQPVEVPEEGQVISPLDAGPTRKWTLTRTINETSSGACAPLFAAPRSGQPGFCQEVFGVESITKVTSTP